MEEKKPNRNLLLIKIHCFLFTGGHAAVLSFTSIYAEQLGISATAIGIILAVIYNVTVVSKAVIGGIVDRFQIWKQMLMLLTLVYVVTDLGLNFLPPPYQESVNTADSNFLCSQGNSYIINYSQDCSLSFGNHTSKCQASCSVCQFKSPYCLLRNQTDSEIPELPSYNLENINLSDIDNSSAELLQTCLNDKDPKCTESCFDGSDLCKSTAGTNPPFQLGLISLLLTVTYIASGSISSLTDAACYIALGDQPENYGKIKLWGNIGWGTCMITAGFLNQLFSQSSKIYSYSSSFYMLAVLFALDLFVLKMLDLKDVTVSKNICKDIGNVLVKPRVQIFVLAVFVMGMNAGVYRAYLFWYLRTTLGANQLILGFTTGAECFLSELPFYYFSGSIINKLGHMNTITLSYISYGMKSIFHSLLINPWFAVLVELLQGMCYSLFYTSMTSYSKLVSPEGTEATVQGIVQGVFDGLGVATGSVLGGLCVDHYGGRKTFFWMGVMSFIAGMILLLLHNTEKNLSNRDCIKTGAENAVEKPTTKL